MLEKNEKKKNNNKKNNNIVSEYSSYLVVYVIR